MMFLCIFFFALFIIYFALRRTSCKDDAFVITLCLALPFVIFWWFDPIPALLDINMRAFSDAFMRDKGLAAVALANDYGRCTTQHQLYSLFSLKFGSFPLFVPFYWQGQSISADTLIQLWHPVTLILPHFEQYWQGNALKMAACVQISSLGVAQAFLYLLLTRLEHNRFLSFLFSFIAIYNVRMLESFRYQGSLEAYTGMIFACVAIGFFYLSFPKKSTFWYGLLITFSTYWLVTSGHPQFMFYGLLATFAFLFLFPWLTVAIRATTPPPTKILIKFYGYVIFYILLGILFACNYIVPFYFEFLQDNAARAKAAYQDLLLFRLSLWQWLCNFLSPLDTDIVWNGAFGASPAYLYALILTIYACFARSKNKSALFWYGGSLILFFLTLLLALGVQTPVHRWFCEHLPFFGMMRIPGRIAVILPFFLSLMGWAYAVRAKDLDRNIYLVRTICILIAAIVIIAPLLWTVSDGMYIPSRLVLADNIRPLGLITSTYKLNINLIFYFLYSTSAVLFLFIFINNKLMKRKFMIIMTCAVTIAVSAILMMQCNWVYKTGPSPTYKRLITFYSAGTKIRNDGGKMGSEPVTRHYSHKRKFDDNFAGLYWHADVAPDVETYYRAFPENHENLVLIDAPKPSAAVPSGDTKGTQARLKLDYFSFNRFKISVNSEKDGWLKINYAYNNRWHPYVNGKAVPLYRANGAEMAVPIQAGTQVIEFYYDKTYSLIGMAISCATLLFILICCIKHSCLLRRHRAVSVILYSLSILLCVFILYAYDHSIYSGENIPFTFSRTYPEV